MAKIYHIPFSLSYPTFEFRKPLFYYQPQHVVPYLISTKKHGFICFACSIKQIRVRKKVKSNEELRSEIVEFISLAGLPQGHFPSMKELSAHGRVDLANIVRRRGYKFVKELLGNSDMEDCNELVSEKSTNIETNASSVSSEDSLTEGQGEGVRDMVDNDLSTDRPSGSELCITAPDGSMPLDQERNNYIKEDAITNSSPETEVHGSVNKDELSLIGVSSTENSFSNLGDSNQSGEITKNTLKIDSVELNDRADIGNSSSEAIISASHPLFLHDTSSCPDREAGDVLMTENGEVNNLDKDFSPTHDHYTSPINNHYTSPTNDHYSSPTNEHYTSPTYNHYTSPDLSYTKRVDIATESLSADMAESRSGSGDDSLVESENNDWMSRVSSSTSSIEERTTRFIRSGYLDTVDDEITLESDPEEAIEGVETTKSNDSIGDSYGGQRSVSTPSNGSALTLEEVTHATEVNSFDSNSGQREGNDDLGTDTHDETRKQENQVEITRLRSMLHQKELELSRLKEQIEKEKLSLSVLQRQAESEIHKAQMLILEKDAELQEVEENLSGLQEVVVEYCGDGNVVEVTGSFNGWQHRVGMELQASKSIGEQKCWSILLWLYDKPLQVYVRRNKHRLQRNKEFHGETEEINEMIMLEGRIDVEAEVDNTCGGTSSVSTTAEKNKMEKGNNGKLALNALEIKTYEK